MDVKEKEGRFYLDKPPKHPKKVTGTRFAQVLGKNRWSTPFQAWCEMTRAYNKPFEDTIYTSAGKTLEPKQIEYLNVYYGLTITTPTDKYGEDYFNKTKGDFYPEDNIFGGMWDALATDEDTGEVAVIECKTSKRIEDWQDSEGKIDPPIYYKLQAALYAYLLNTDNVIMFGTFLSDDDYSHLDGFRVSPDNSIIYDFKVSEEFPNFDDLIAAVTEWRYEFIDTGISPEFDETKDKEYLSALRTAHPTLDISTEEALNRLADIKATYDKQIKELEPLEKEMAQLVKLIKDDCLDKIGDKKYCIVGNDRIECKLSATVSKQVDKDKLKEDGLFDKYSADKTTYRMNTKILDKEI